jgi:hypothetical protein
VIVVDDENKCAVSWVLCLTAVYPRAFERCECSSLLDGGHVLLGDSLVQFRF